MSKTLDSADASVQYEAIERFLDALSSCMWVNDEARRSSAFRALQLDHARAAVQHLLLEAQRRLQNKHHKTPRWTDVERNEWQWLLLQLRSLSIVALDDVLLMMLDDAQRMCNDDDTILMTMPTDSFGPTTTSSRMFIPPFLRQFSSSRSIEDVWIQSSSSRRSIDSTRRLLVRSMSSYLGMQHEDTFYCQICFENARTTDSVVLTACGHHFCRECLAQYLTVKINDAQLHPVCFFEEQTTSEREHNTSSTAPEPEVCGRVIRVEDIQAVVSSDTWTKHQRFKLHKENNGARDCPFCNHAQVVIIPDNADSLECVCESCHKTYCYGHSNAHTGRTCAEYEKEIAATEKINRAAISAISKPCPGCNCPVEKNGGCNHMTCQACQTDFCWLCNAVIEGSTFPAHYQWWNLDGCPGAHFDATDPAMTTHACWSRLGIAIVGLPAYSAAFVVALLAWPWRPLRSTFFEYFTLFMDWWHQLLTFVLMLLCLLLLLALSPLFGLNEYRRRAFITATTRAQQMRDAFNDKPNLCACTTCHQRVTGTPDFNMCSTCARCSARVCWTCGQSLPTPEAQRYHFKWWHVRACSSADSLRISCYAALSLLLCGIPALVLTMLLWPLRCARGQAVLDFGYLFNWCLRRCMAVIWSLLLAVWLLVELTLNLIGLPGWGCAAIFSALGDETPAENAPQ